MEDEDAALTTTTPSSPGKGPTHLLLGLDHDNHQHLHDRVHISSWPGWVTGFINTLLSFPVHSWFFFGVTIVLDFNGFIFITEMAMAPHSSTLAWKIPRMAEPGGLQSMRSRRVGHDWATSLSLFTFMHWEGNGNPLHVLAWRIPNSNLKLTFSCANF